MLVLGIESSCDDTSVTLLEASEKGHVVISEVTASQIEIHKKYGGVVPEIAGRLHAEKIVPLIEEVLSGHPKPDVIAATAGPGLITGLIVGTEAARALSYTWDIPLVAVNHIEGHIYSVELTAGQKIEYPALALVVSGGHTEIIQIDNPGEYKLLGHTKDDAAGECFDKVAKLLDLPYPGGPQISKLAETGKTDAIIFPRPMIKEDNLDFSFSGLKTSALYWLQKNKLESKEDFCASFEQAIVDVLVDKTIRAVKIIKPKTLILAGGVSANKKLRETLKQIIKTDFPETKFIYPDLKYCMDNAAMIAVAGYYQSQKQNFTSWKEIKADPNWHITQ